MTLAVSGISFRRVVLGMVLMQIFAAAWLAPPSAPIRGGITSCRR
jgi:hypothetical protein